MSPPQPKSTPLFVAPSPLRIIATTTTTVGGSNRCQCTPTAQLPKTQENASTTPGKAPERAKSGVPHYDFITDIITGIRTVFKLDMGSIFTSGVGFGVGTNKETVHVLRVNSPKPLRIELKSGIHSLHEGENMLKFSSERSAVRTAWIIQDAAAYQRIALHDISLAVQKLSSEAGLSLVKPIPERDINEIDPLHFLPDVIPADENDLSDWMGGVHWEDCERTRFVCDMTPGPNEDVKLDEEWKETIGKLTLLEIDETDPECRLCGGTGRRRCSRCGGAAAMALPGSDFACVCYSGEVACNWCAGDGIPR